MQRTEKINPKAADIDILAIEDILRLMNDEDSGIISAVRSAISDISEAVEDAFVTIKNGGRIFYAGAGTSGRLGVLDASEIPPTFGVSQDMFHAVMAGGEPALTSAVEGAEDDISAGRDAALIATEKDFVLGISASGTTPFVVSFLEGAKARGAKCRLLTCSESSVSSLQSDAELTPVSGLRPPALDGVIRIITGPEIIAGSTRLKAGTATKLALNMFSTSVMIRLGSVYKGLMVDVVPSNKKLVARAENIIMEITGSSREDASGYLKLSGMRPKTAVAMIAKGVSKENAEELLRTAGGSLRKVIG